MMLFPLPTCSHADAGAFDTYFLSVFKNQFMKPYVGCTGVGVVAIFTHSSDNSCRSFHFPRRIVSRPKRAMSSALMNMPPPQCPPPATDCTGCPSISTHDVS